MSDILVIGGGVAGLSAAAHLSAAAKVTLLEREPSLGYHASGRSAALFEENYGLPSTVALNAASKQYLSEEEGGYLSARGFLIVARTQEEEAFEKDVATLKAEPVAPERALELVPILKPETLAFAAYHEEALDIDTDRVLQGFARRLRANGGLIITGAEVTQILRQGNSWEVVANGATYKAGHIVNAAGAWADEIAKLAGLPPIGLVPHRRSMARIPAPEGRDVSRWPMFFGVGETWYAKPDAGALLISPADEDPLPPQDAWADDMVLAEGIARYQEMVRPEVTRIQSNWAGLRTFAPDRALVLGPDPLEPSFIWSAGQGGYGFSSGPAAGRLVADLTLDRAPALAEHVVEQLRPDRLRH